jgi:hypothetical protein
VRAAADTLDDARADRGVAELARTATRVAGKEAVTAADARHGRLPKSPSPKQKPP